MLAATGISIAALGLLSVIGLYGTFRKDQTCMRAYAFMLLVLVLLQVSIITVLYNNIDSGFTDKLLEILGTLCAANSVSMLGHGSDAVPRSEPESFVNQTDGSGSSAEEFHLADGGLLDQLCSCRVSGGRECVKAWISTQLVKLSLTMGSLLVFEGTCAVLAWTYVSSVEKEEVMKIKKKAKFVPDSTVRQRPVADASSPTLCSSNNAVLSRRLRPFSGCTAVGRPARAPSIRLLLCVLQNLI